MAMKDELRQKLLEKKINSEEESLRKRVWDESKKIWVVAGPAIFTRFSSFGMNVITQAFVGHIGSTELAAYALVSTVLTRFVIGILVCLYVSYYYGLFQFFNC
jgi:MATE family multidrug resistance protein